MSIKGFALFEVLVSLVIMSLGMLGIITILIMTSQASVSSYLKQQAIQTAYNMLDTMRANRDAAMAGSYIIATSTVPTPTTNCESSVCSADAMAAYNRWYWQTYDVARLPGGVGTVATTLSGQNTQVIITVQWDDSPAQKNLGRIATTGTQKNLVQFTLSTML